MAAPWGYLSYAVVIPAPADINPDIVVSAFSRRKDAEAFAGTYPIAGARVEPLGRSVHVSTPEDAQ